MSFQEIKDRFSGRLRVIDRFVELDAIPEKVVFIENEKDVKHARTQWRPFFAEVDSLPSHLKPNITRFFYDRLGDRGQTHTTMDTPTTVQVLSHLLNGNPSHELLSLRRLLESGVPLAERKNGVPG